MPIYHYFDTFTTAVDFILQIYEDTLVLASTIWLIIWFTIPSWMRVNFPNLETVDMFSFKQIRNKLYV